MCDIGTNYIKTIKATTLFVVFLFVHSWEQRKLWQLTIWDKKFNGVESYKQVKVIKYPYVLADVFSQIEDTSGTVRLLSTGSYIGYTTKEKAGNNLCYGEIVAIPWGGVANIKYYNGFFVTADNRIATSSNTQVLSNRYLHWWMESNITQIQSTYRGASIQHPSMNDILSLSIYLPSIEEQEKISNKLDTLDNLITLHQRKDFSRFSQILRRKKHSFLPISWEQRKLGETTQIIMGQSPDGSTYSDFPTDYILVQGNADLENGWVKPRIWTTQKTKYAVAGDLIMSVRAPAGSMGKTAYNVVLGRGVAAIKGNEFIFQVLTKMDLEGFWKKLSAGSTFESLNSDNIINANINLPSNLEQDKIGSIFENIDNLITLHQRECFYIYKKYLLFLEMQNSHKRNYSWEQRKLGDYFIERNERSGDGEMISVTINSGIRKFDELNRHDTKPDDLSKYKRVEIGDIAYNSMRMWQGASGYSPYSGILSPAYTVITPKEGVSSRFFAYLIKRPKTIHLFEINSQGLTKDTWNLKFPAFAPIEVKAPVSYEEQVNISRILIQLDNLITLHQCESCKKVGAVQSAFARRNLSKWADSWEQRKLYDIADRFDNLRIPVAANLRIHGITPYYGANGIQDYVSGYTHDGEFVLVAEDGANDLKNYPVNYVKGRIWVNNHAHVLQGKAKLLDNKFLSYLINRADIESLLVGCGRAKLNAETMMNIVFLVPNYEEQIEIGNYLSKIDYLITLHQRIKIFFTGDYHDKKNK